jgi:tetratricopeptide (TPR) repeat protein/predicted AlkP superfamily phosphohydrolase/phosphomutase
LKLVFAFVVLAAAALLILSIRIVGTDEVALVGGGSDTRELSPGLNFVRPFTHVREFKLRQEYELHGDNALVVQLSSMAGARLDCDLEVEFQRDKIRALDRDYSDRVFEKLLRPILLREVSAHLAEGRKPTPDMIDGAGPQIAASMNEKTEGLGITVTSLRLENLHEQPLVAHDLERSDGLKVFVLGLDGYDWLIMEKVLETRDLPNIRRVRREGASGNLRSIEPLVSPLIWTTMVTGVTPDVHGITDFLVRDEVTGEDIPVTSSMRRVPSLWNITSLFDMTCGFIGWFASFPAEEVKGFIVSDRFAYHMFDPGWAKGRKQVAGEGLTYPRDIHEEIDHLRLGPEEVHDDMSHYINGPVSPFKTGEDGLLYWDRMRPDDPEGNLRLVISAYKTYERVVQELYPTERPDLFGVYFEFTDSAAHLFMKFMKPAMTGVSPEEEQRYGDAIAGTYAEADRIIGDVLGMLDDSTVLMIVSDHGFKSGDMRPLSDSRMGFGQAINWHRINGSIALFGNMVKPGCIIADAGVMDIAPTILYLLGLPVDRKMSGKILFDAFDDSWVENHPVSYTSRYDSLIVGQEVAVRPSAADQALKDKLVSLGYVAGGSTALVNLATYYHKNGRYAEALEVWKELLELEPENVGHRIGMSNAYADLGKPDIAIKSLNEVLEIDPGNMLAMHSLVTIHIEKGMPREALAVAERAIAVDDTDGRSYLDKGMALELLGRSQEAAQAYQRAIALAPDLAEAHANLAQIYAKSGRTVQALESAQKAVALAAGKPEIHYVLGIALKANGRQEEALDQFVTALRADTTFVPAYIGVSGILLSQGKTDSVLALCSKALRFPSQYGSYIHSMKGSAHLARGELKMAADEFKAAIAGDPGNAVARINLAGIYAREGKKGDAIRELEQVLDMHPNHPEALNLLETLR